MYKSMEKEEAEKPPYASWKESRNLEHARPSLAIDTRPASYLQHQIVTFFPSVS
jgi:hypothetical protein